MNQEDMEVEWISCYVEYLMQCIKEGRNNDVPSDWYDIVIQEMKQEA